MVLQWCFSLIFTLIWETCGHVISQHCPVSVLDCSCLVVVSYSFTWYHTFYSLIILDSVFLQISQTPAITPHREATASASAASCNSINNCKTTMKGCIEMRRKSIDPACGILDRFVYVVTFSTKSMKTAFYNLQLNLVRAALNFKRTESWGCLSILNSKSQKS